MRFPGPTWAVSTRIPDSPSTCGPTTTPRASCGVPGQRPSAPAGLRSLPPQRSSCVVRKVCASSMPIPSTLNLNVGSARSAMVMGLVPMPWSASTPRMTALHLMWAIAASTAAATASVAVSTGMRLPSALPRLALATLSILMITATAPVTVSIRRHSSASPTSVTGQVPPVWNPAVTTMIARALSIASAMRVLPRRTTGRPVLLPTSASLITA